MSSEKTREELLRELQSLEKDLERWSAIVSGYERKYASMEKSIKQQELFLKNFSGIAYGGYIGSLPEFYQGSIKSITGYTAGELVAGTPLWKNIVYYEDVSSYNIGFEKLWNIPRYSSRNEYRITQKNGEIRWVQEYMSNLIDSSGKPYYYQGTIYDVTEYGYAGTKRATMTDIGSSGAFIADIAHDFNNLLLAIAGNISLAKMRINPEDKMYALLSEAERISFLGKDLTRQLMTFSKDGKRTQGITDIQKDPLTFKRESKIYSISEKKSQKRKKKVLFMDDEKILCDVAEQIIRGIGYEPVIASHGNEAIALYRREKESGVLFEAAILDLTVKNGMGGKDTLPELLRIDPGIKAIISSGYSDNEIIEKHRDYGFVGAIAKPYKARELKELLEKVIWEEAE